ncbi:unnamed protein product [Spirodela intermedia]|uniref:Uncharacterized protein n=1 Tax=Spirodela intermedia TaxID=51605 RepID=A0A7I8IME6_SPIIN|nr:unnamed protein product [Spirodela intermedia]CAA6659016.1 unnamed protein product [Spirodela intermedia]
MIVIKCSIVFCIRGHLYFIALYLRNCTFIWGFFHFVALYVC